MIALQNVSKNQKNAIKLLQKKQNCYKIALLEKIVIKFKKIKKGLEEI